MRKKFLSIPVIFLILSSLMIFGSIALINFWRTDPEAICNIAGGWWGPVGCENLCDKSKSGYNCTELPFHMDCTCGRYENTCWDGNKCVPIQK